MSLLPMKSLAYNGLTLPGLRQQAINFDKDLTEVYS